MSDAFRIHYNHGLEKAINLARLEDLDLQIILFRKDEENNRNNEFFQEGIKGFEGFLSKFSNNVYFFSDITDFFYKVLIKSSHVIKDRAYLKENRVIEQEIKEFLIQSEISFTLVESNVLVPVLSASNKEEYGARTIRPKIHKQIHEFLDIKDSEKPSFFFEQEARDKMYYFIDNKLEHYDISSDPSFDYTSGLSPYLKYGFISPQEIYHAVLASKHEHSHKFIEELIIRRELSYNFIYYNDGYDDFNSMTYEWAYQTMNAHKMDPKEYIYTKDDYINFNTHDPYFNAAMKEMVLLGKMHNYMRMYWAKKVIEWSPSFLIAYQTLIELNNYYFLDGNTPNGYTGVAWCFGKHDRAWPERLIFGKLRYMNMNGLKRKFDIDKYVLKIERMVGDKNG
jgi:deoxyribodipyrimidine photo-lyase